jgi:phosphate uptake regulator
MESRKIIKFGNSSYVVSIPKDWMKENSIKKGDLLFLDTSSDGDLIVHSKESKKSEPRQVTMDISQRDFWSIKRELNFFYIDDFDIITLKGTHPDKNKIENVIKKMIGAQIIENSNELLIIKNILDLEHVTIQDIFRRTDNLIRSMFMELKEGFEKEKVSPESLKSIYTTDLEINSLYFLLMKIIRKGFKDRQFSKIIKKEPLELNYLHHLILNIEIVGDHIKRIAKTMNVSSIKSKHIKEMQKILGMTEKAYE